MGKMLYKILELENGKDKIYLAVACSFTCPFLCDNMVCSVGEKCIYMTQDIIKQENICDKIFNNRRIILIIYLLNDFSNTKSCIEKYFDNNNTLILEFHQRRKHPDDRSKVMEKLNVLIQKYSQLKVVSSIPKSNNVKKIDTELKLCKQIQDQNSVLDLKISSTVSQPEPINNIAIKIGTRSINIYGRLREKHQGMCPVCKIKLDVIEKIKIEHSIPRTIEIYHCSQCSHNYCKPVDYDFIKRNLRIINGLDVKLENKNADSPKNKVFTCEFLKRNHCKILSGPCNRYNTKCVHPLQSKVVYRIPPHYNSVYLTDNSTSADSTKRRYRNHNIDEERYGYNSVVKTLDVTDSPREVHVFGGALAFSKDKVIDRYITVTDIMNPKLKHYILVAYHVSSKHYYLSYTQLQRHIKMGHHLNLKLSISNAGTEMLEDFSGFGQFSELSLYGYHVGVHGLPELQRRKILAYIMDNKILHRWDIIQRLNSNIALREGRIDRDFSVAIKHWEDDIMFIEAYDKDKQLKIQSRLKPSEKCKKCGRPHMAGSEYCFECLKEMRARYNER